MFCRKISICITLLVLTICVQSQNKQYPQTFLWRISGNGLSKPSFLYGTIHLSDKKLFYFSDSLYHYLEQAEGFNIEIDVDSMINASVRKLTQNNKGRLLKSLMNKKDYEKYADKLSKKLGKPSDKITTNDIWVAKNEKTAEAYKKGNMQSFMDVYLYGIARKQGKKVGGIEDVADQMDIFDDLFDEYDLAYVTSDTLQEMESGMVKRMKEIYIKQDLNAVKSLTEGLGNQKYTDIVLNKRNLKMAWRMDSLARQRSSFFAVGVAHLPGDTGVINLLQKRGFTVEPVLSTKKIAPQNYSYKTVELPWVTYTHDLHLYKAEAPGALQPLNLAEEVMDMEYYYDMPNAKAYYTAVVNSVSDPNKKDSVFNGMVKRMASNNLTLVSQKNIIKQNYEGRDVIMKSGDDQLLHFNVYMASNYAYMAMILCKKADVNDKDSKRFFESFSMTPATALSKPYIDFSDTTLAFSVALPQQPLINEQKETEGRSGDLKVFSATDFSSGNSYAITVTNTKVGNYITSDSIYLGQIKANLLNIMKEDTVIEMSAYKGYPALKVSGSAKANNAYFKTLTVLRGNRAYCLAAQFNKAIASDALADNFFRSFTLSDYYSNKEWKRSAAPDNSFAAWLPALFAEPSEESAPSDTVAAAANDSFVTAKNEEDEVKNEFLFYDKSTGTSYNIQREAFSDYYYSANDSTFFSDAGSAFKAEGDSIVSFKLLNFSNHKAADIQIEHPNTSIVKKFRFIVHGDTLYKVFTYTPRWLADNENTQKFFNQLSFTSTPLTTTLFTNKTSKLIADLTSTDSASFEKASDYIYSSSLYKSDLNTFYPLLIKPLKDFSESSFNTNNKLIDAIAVIADSSTVNFIVQQYPGLQGEQHKLQYSLLKLLVKMKQPYANEAAVKLLNLSNAPAGDISVFAPALYSNLPVAKLLFPKIISFTKDTTAALEYAYVITQLLDSNYVTRQEILPYLDNFIATAARQKSRIHTNEDDYDYSLLRVLDLFGTLNNTVSNAQLQEYSKVNNLDVAYRAVAWLIKNEQPLPVDAINKLAFSNQYRTDIYDTLKSVNKTALFPAGQLSQKMFAASYIYNFATEDETPDAIKYIMEKVITFRGKKQKFYLFKVTFDEGEDATNNLGIAGPFSLNASPVTSKNLATGIYWQKDYSAKEVNKQFDEYLKQLEEEEEEE